MARVSKAGHASDPQKLGLEYRLSALVADSLITPQRQQQLHHRPNQADKDNLHPRVIAVDRK